MLTALCGDELGNIKYLMPSENLEKMTSFTLASGSGCATQSLALNSSWVSAGYSNGSVALYSLKRDNHSLEPKGTCEAFNLEKGGRHVGIGILDETKLVACSSAGSLVSMEFNLGENTESSSSTILPKHLITRSVPNRLNVFKISHDRHSFICGGEEVSPSLWNLEHILGSTESVPSKSTASSSGKRKRKDGDLFPGELWRAQNVPNDSLGLRQPIRITSMDFIKDHPNNHCEIVVGTELGDIRRYDTRASRRECARWQMLKQGGVGLVKKGSSENLLFFADTVNSLSCVDLRTGRVIYGFRGISGTVSSIVCHDAEALATSHDGFVYSLTSPPPNAAGGATSVRGVQIHREYLKTVPLTLELDPEMANAGPPTDQNDEDDIWQQMEKVETGDEGVRKKTKRSHP